MPPDLASLTPVWHWVTIGTWTRSDEQLIDYSSSPVHMSLEDIWEDMTDFKKNHP
jgi:hypothetical protein